MTEVQISDEWFCREIQNFVDFYKSNKKFSKLIRDKVFKVITPEGTNIKFKVTYVKNQTYLKVNIKICGYVVSRLSYYDGVYKLTKENHYGFRSVVRRNEVIRNEINDEVKRYFAMLGMAPYYVKVGTIKICDEL